VDRVGLKYAQKVFRDGFVRHRDAFTVHVPRVPLGRLYGDELRAWLSAHNVTLRESASVRALHGSAEGITGAELRDGATLTADRFVLAVPFDRVCDLLPPELAALPYFAGARELAPSPITSVHLWYDRPALKLPHAVLVDCLSQWVFDRGETSPGEFYLQVVVSAARDLKGLGRDEIQRRVAEELARVFPGLRAANVLRGRVVTEHTATFSAVPGVDKWRVPQGSPVPNLAVAGDWTDTGWPATMEGAVRSGYLAAEALLARAGVRAQLVQPDLG
jgi:squalene-associated FAD-dependent desaturase